MATVLLDRVPGVSIDHDVGPTTEAIITDVRLPRVLLAALVGSVLATAGGAYQATFHNPLADPYLLGAAGGAGLGVTLALTETGGDLGEVGTMITLAAFVGAVVAVGTAYLLGAGRDGRSGASLILAGVAVAALCAALQSLLLQRDDEAVRDVYALAAGPVQRRRLGRGPAPAPLRHDLHRRAGGVGAPPRRARPGRRRGPVPRRRRRPGAAGRGHRGDAGHRSRGRGERSDRLRRHHRAPRHPAAGRAELPPHPAPLRHPRRARSCAWPTSSPAASSPPPSSPSASSPRSPGRRSSWSCCGRAG